MKNNFYEFSQNNSGGFFEYTDNVSEHVIIEAPSEEKALEIAENIGIYFDGVERELDCECCGDRWCSYTYPMKLEIKHYQDSLDGLDDFSVYDNIHDYILERTRGRYVDTSIYKVHFLSGEVANYRNGKKLTTEEAKELVEKWNKQ